MRAFVRVLGVARRHLPWLLAATVCMVLVAGATVTVVYLIQPVYDHVLMGDAATEDQRPSLPPPLQTITEHVTGEIGGDVRRILFLALMAVVVKNMATFGGRYAMSMLGLGTVRDLRNLVFAALVRQSPHYFEESSSGQLVSRVISDIQVIHEAVAERVGDLLQDVLTIAVLLAYVLLLDTWLAIATLVLAPVVLAPVVQFARRLRVRARQSQQRMGEIATVLDETVRGMRIVQAFGLEERMDERFRTTNQRQFASALAVRVIQSVNAPVMEILGSVAALALIAYASRQIQSGAMTLGGFSSFLTAVYMMYNPVKRLNKLNLAVQQAASASERVYEVIDAPVTVSEKAGAAALVTARSNLELDRVWFAYQPERWVLHDLSFQVPDGSTVALVGPSGAGKSTVASLILRFWDVQRGAVRLGGADVRDVTLASLRRHVGLVTQETFLFNDTVEANIRCGAPDASFAEIEACARLAHAEEFIRKLPDGYATVVGERGDRLSGGQRQRLSIARALLKDPPLLVLDEATAALDAQSEQLVQEAMEAAMRGRTTLVIAHRLSTVVRADAIVVMSEGRIVEQGRHDELVKSGGLYARMVELQDLSPSCPPEMVCTASKAVPESGPSGRSQSP